MYRITVILLTLLSINTFAQKKSYNITIDWKNELGSRLPYFTDCQYPDSLPETPHYIKIINVPANITEADVKLKKISLTSAPQFNNLLNDSIPTEVVPSYKIVVTKKQKQLQLTFNAALVQNGAYSLVTGLDVIVQYKQSNTPENEAKRSHYKTTSVLNNGLWRKIRVKKSGIYKITYNQLVSWGFSNPENVSVYGMGGKQLSYRVNNDDPYSLPEIPIQINRGNDGVFNSGDYILFYGQGYINRSVDPYSKQIHLHPHDYSESGHYFITTSAAAGERIQEVNHNSLTPDRTLNTFQDVQLHYQRTKNLNKTGRVFFGDALTSGESETFSFNFPNLVSSESARIYTYVGAICEGTTSYFHHSANGTQFRQVPVEKSTSYFKGHGTENISYINVNDESFNIELKYMSSNITATGHVGKVLAEVTRNLIFTNGQMVFQAPQYAFRDLNIEYNIQGVTSETQIWNIGNGRTPQKVEWQRNGTTGQFVFPADEHNLFIAFDDSDYLTPTDAGEVENQNILANNIYDYVIVTHPKFRPQAEELASFHTEHSGMRVLVIEPQTIYNEFSSGTQDASAIRNFLKMLYDRASTPDEMPKHLLLFGDGSYDNISTENNTNLIPTFQTNRIESYLSVACDDFFVMLDIGEGGDEGDIDLNGTLDMGVGRFPVNNTDQANILLDKTTSYIGNPILGPWKNELLFVGDDADGGDYYLQQHSYALSNIVRDKYKWLNPRMVLMDAYPQQSTPAGERYPEVTKAINEHVHRGVLLINYTGHGSETRLAHEAILDKNTISSWTNEKLPFLMTGSCEVSRFDNKDQQSLGEAILLKRNAGVMTLFSTTRVVYGHSNQELSKEFYNQIFTPNADGTYKTLGELIALTKNRTGGNNKRNFMLFGDPALRLDIPPMRIVADSVNGNDAEVYQDTLKALKKITMYGHISDSSGNSKTNFNGTLYPTVFDKMTRKETLNNDNSSSGTFSYSEFSNIIYKGQASVQNGKFQFEFIVPIDINYEFGRGKISFYSEDGTTDGYGYFDNFLVGGSDTAQINDTKGPEISVYLNDTTFITGGTVNESPLLIAHLTDEYGINTTGNVIGHDLTATLNDNIDNKIVLNDFFENDLNSYQSGKVNYQLLDLDEGLNTMKVKAWDILNNSSETYLDFFVANSAEVALKHVLNYPNPFTTNTKFMFEHNQASQLLNVRVQIFTVSGKLIKTLETTVAGTQYMNNPIVWDGRDDFGDRIARGVYIYKLRISTPEGKSGEKFEKLVILR
ncbi:MAG: type IX secretion system sortase PorU [Salinivirgaceae bacterium]